MDPLKRFPAKNTKLIATADKHMKIPRNIMSPRCQCHEMQYLFVNAHERSRALMNYRDTRSIAMKVPWCSNRIDVGAHGGDHNGEHHSIRRNAMARHGELPWRAVKQCEG